MAVKSPWPGPVPYDERDAAVFFGRSNEVQHVVSRMLGARLHVLAANSGVGKTSFIRAGLVPALRQLREMGRPFGPTLILGSWGKFINDQPAGVFAEAIREEIVRAPSTKRTPRQEEDFKALRRITPPDNDGASPSEQLANLIRYVDALCSVGGGLVLIVDQAEELLGSGLDAANRTLEDNVLGTLGELYRSQPRLKILISLREEYYLRLRVLNSYIEGLASRTIRLEPMAPKTAKQVILDAADASTDIDLDPDAAEMLLGWVADSVVAPSRADGDPPPEASDDEEGGSVNLLGLQALLLEIVDWRARADGTLVSGQRLRIGPEHLAAFQRELGSRSGTTGAMRAGVDLAKEALLRYIDRLFDASRLAGAADDRLLDASRLADAVAEPLPDVMRMLLVRMAPWLSTLAGFKKHQPEVDLVLNAVWPDLQRLGVLGTKDTLKNQLSTYQLGKPLHLALDPFAAEDNDGRDRRSRVAVNWSLEKTASELIQSGFLLMQYLSKPEIAVLKGSVTDGQKMCELVHDGLGPALKTWAEREQISLRYSLSTIVSLGGEDFHWQDITRETLSKALGRSAEAPDAGVIEALCWLTCRFNATFKDVEFVDCTLKGSLFDRCTFDNCTFTRCDLAGAFFKKSIVRGGGLVFNHCTMDSVVFKEVEIGSVTVHKCSLQFAQLLPFKGQSPRSLDLVHCDLRNALFMDVGETEWATMIPVVDMAARRNMVEALPRLIERTGPFSDREQPAPIPAGVETLGAG